MVDAVSVAGDGAIEVMFSVEFIKDLRHARDIVPYREVFDQLEKLGIDTGRPMQLWISRAESCVRARQLPWQGEEPWPLL